MRKLFTLIVLGIVMVGLTVVGSDAGVKKIRPDQFKVVGSFYVTYQTPYYVSSANSNECTWTAVAKLPVGKRITKMIYYHYGVGSPSSTACYLYRYKMGGEENPEVVASTNVTANDIGLLTLENTTIIYPKIKRGYTYYVRIRSSDDDSQIRGVRVFYK